jgi:hypothetical protein
MIKISEALIQLEEQPVAKTAKVVRESADRILKHYRMSQEPKSMPVGSVAPEAERD